MSLHVLSAVRMREVPDAVLRGRRLAEKGIRLVIRWRQVMPARKRPVSCDYASRHGRLSMLAVP